MTKPVLGAVGVDAALRSGLKRSLARTLLGPAFLVAAGAVALVLFDHSVGLTAMVAAFGVLLLTSLETLLRVPRPRPRMISGGIVLRNSRVLGVAMTAMSLLLTVAIVGLLAESDMRDQRRAASLPFLVVVGVLVVCAAGALIWRPGTVRVTPEGVGTRRLLERPTWISWDAVETIGVPDDLTNQQVASMPLLVAGSDSFVQFGTTILRPSLWVLREWLSHYADHPADRHELSGQAGVDRLWVIETELSTGRLWPRWFAPPRTES